LAGILYIVATPIGNLEDITLRALRILRDEVAVIACEDTRQTQKLLEHFQIRKPMVSYHEHNEASRTAELIERLERGESVALVSDAGTPLLSDPGYRIVSAATERNLTVVPLPGASAALAALSASGLPTNEFRFIGFVPQKAGARRKMLEDLLKEEATVIAYDSPHRILETLAAMAEVFGNRPIVVARELTKLHEEFLRGTAAGIQAQLSERASVKGEFTILIGKAQNKAQDVPSAIDPLTEIERLQREEHLDRMGAIKLVAKELGLPKREVYRLALEQDNNPPDKHRG
jgi:16S rRNA (cytidine1402-2'-O)-methyltransferase